MIRFSKYIWVYFLISSLVLVPGIFSLVIHGLKQSIDFTGGTLLEVRVPPGSNELTIETQIKEASVSAESIVKSENQTYLVRFKPFSEPLVNLVAEKLASISGQKAEVLRSETVGPVIGKELLSKALGAALLSVIAILLYVAYAFKNIKFGISAILALFHDLLIVLSVFSLVGVEVDTLFVTAFLTTMSFSVHDTIVVFDRIRELVKRGERISFEEVCDKALTETMGRSLTNSMTIIFMLLALVLLGGGNIRWFVMALIVGTVSGTYSSPFIATPILILWDRWEKRKKK